MNFQHYPVMSKEVFTLIKDAKGKIVIDCTLGMGSHSYILLKELKDIRIIGIELDNDSIKIAKENLKEFKERIETINIKFEDIPNYKNINWKNIRTIFVDSGISTYQLKSKEKGFSHTIESRLDMRKNKNIKIDAYQIINHFSQNEIENILRDFGDVKVAKALSKKIIERRLFKKIEKTIELRELVENFYKWRPKQGKTSPAAKVFQALRIYINKETEELENFINQVVKKLNKGARIIFLTYHSIEDKIVKNEFHKLKNNGFVRIIKPFPMLPTKEEIKVNPASRSARLRCVEVV